MQVGSIVQCINNEEYKNHAMKIPSLTETYTVRYLEEKGTEIKKGIRLVRATEDLIYLEELVNETIYWGGIAVEFAYLKKDFRELLPPIQINIEEIILQEV